MYQNDTEYIFGIVFFRLKTLKKKSFYEKDDFSRNQLII